MKNLFEISGEERSRILSLHERATKKHYILEQDTENITYSSPSSTVTDGVEKVKGFYDSHNNTLTLTKTYEVDPSLSNINMPTKNELEQNGIDDTVLSWTAELNDKMGNETSLLYVPTTENGKPLWVIFKETESGFEYNGTTEAPLSVE